MVDRRSLPEGDRVDGREVTGAIERRCDVVVVGSGPAGASVAADLAARGLDVVVVEAGRWFRPDEFRPGAFDSMGAAYRQMGASVVVGSGPMPYLQGRMVGGSSPINGAICWRLPHDVHQEWVAADPVLGDALPWEALESITDRIEARLGVAPTDPAVAGPKNELMARGAEALGLAHRPIRRNVDGCRGLGRCMQGCPEGNKLSVDRTLLVDALAHGATVISSVEVDRLLVERGRAVGVSGRAEGGGVVRVRADRAVVVAASAVQTPALLLANGLVHGPVGRHFQGHPGISMSGRFAEPVRMWEGASQGHEVTGLRHEGLKFEVLGLPLDVLAVRMPGVGRDLARHLEDLAHHVDWGAAVRAEAHGRVRLVRGRTVVTYRPTANDLAKFRQGLRVMGELLFAAGAESVDLGLRGYPSHVTDPADLARLEADGPRRASAFTSAVTHLFGTARMGADPARSVVGPDFRHHDVDRLYVADSSVFPTNTGVNPQISIMALATLCARRIAGVDPDRPPEPTRSTS
jgi:choline dehydrogenase-like flavoprotein